MISTSKTLPFAHTSVDGELIFDQEFGVLATLGSVNFYDGHGIIILLVFGGAGGN